MKPLEFMLGKHKNKDYWVGVPVGHVAELILCDEIESPFHVREVVPIDWGKILNDDAFKLWSEKNWYINKIQQLVEKQLAGEE